MTTRPKRAGDRDGVDYRFVDRRTFLAEREAGRLLEWAEVFGNLYGTPRGPVERTVAEGGLMILEIDVEGAVQVKERFAEAMAIFIEPPSRQVLLERLRGRARDEEATIQRRFQKASDEIDRAHACGIYDAFVVNDELEQAVDRTLALVRRRLESSGELREPTS